MKQYIVLFLCTLSLYSKELSDSEARNVRDLKKSMENISKILNTVDLDKLSTDIQDYQGLSLEQKNALIEKLYLLTGTPLKIEDNSLNQEGIFCNLQQPLAGSPLSTDNNIGLSALPLANWINLSLLDPWNNVKMHRLSERDEHFCLIESFNDAFIGLQPYALYSPYVFQHARAKLWSTGITLQGGARLNEECVLGAGGGYEYSNIHWSQSQMQMQGIYIGPTLTYFLQKAYLSLRTLAEYVFYNANQIGSFNGWNIEGAFNGGLEFEIQPSFFLCPNIELRYLWNSLNAPAENTFVKGAQFFRSKLDLQIKKESYINDHFIIQQFAMGWVWMQPISQTYQGPKQINTYSTSQQLFAALEISIIFQTGIVLEFDLEGYLDKTYPAYKAGGKLEWNW